MIIFGGASNSVFYNTIIENDALEEHWDLIEPSGKLPNPRCNHAASTDSAENLLVVGGYSDSGYLNDVWIFSLSKNDGLLIMHRENCRHRESLHHWCFIIIRLIFGAGFMKDGCRMSCMFKI
jgi:hypothetical protein